MHTPLAFVTGGARRIGAQITRSLVGAGWRVVFTYRGSQSEADALLGELGEERCRALPLELSALDQLEATLRQVVAEEGGVDLLVNNASVFPSRPVGEIDLAHWREVMDVNLGAACFLTQAAAPALAQRRGSVVNLCDVYGERPSPGRPLYSVSKAGLIMLTQALALELAPDVRVNGVNPGAILFPENASDEAKEQVLERTPLARAGAPEDIADAVLYLARAPFVTGHVLTVDGGRSVLP